MSEMDIVTILMIVLVVVSCGGFVWAIVESERYLNRRERELKGEKDERSKKREDLC